MGLSPLHLCCLKPRTITFPEVADLIEPVLRDMGFELVQVRIGGGARSTVQIMAEPADRTRPMTVDDCAEISHAVSAVLDVADPLPGAYTLEVSSPGIDRPLVRRDDFARFAGHEAKLESDVAVEGRKRFRGGLKGIEGDEVLIDVEGTTYRVPFTAVRKAKLVLTDALLNAAARRQEQGQGH
ncbi:MAG: ribosome maturation factor RimP [Geminicoccaceae bacterium]